MCGVGGVCCWMLVGGGLMGGRIERERGEEMMGVFLWCVEGRKKGWVRGFEMKVDKLGGR